MGKSFYSQTIAFIPVCQNHTRSYGIVFFHVAKMFITTCKSAGQSELHVDESKDRKYGVRLIAPTASAPTPVPNIPNPDICDQVRLKEIVAKLLNSMYYSITNNQTSSLSEDVQVNTVM